MMRLSLLILALLCCAASAQDSAATSSLTIAPCRASAFCTQAGGSFCGCNPVPLPRPIPDPRPCNCFLLFSPICGKDGRTYSNSCELRCKGAQKACDGRCPCPSPPGGCKCTKEFRPVCGRDGTTYSNSCVAGCAGAIVNCSGRCPCRPTPSPTPPPPTDCVFANGRFTGGCKPPGPPPSTPGEINNFLDDCKERGESASVAAARAACSTLKNKCPSVRPTAALASAASFGRGGADSFNPADALLEKVLEGACLTEAENACKNRAFDSVTDSTCKRLLSSGPAQGVSGCRNVQDVSNIFNGEVNRLCRNK